MRLRSMPKYSLLSQKCIVPAIWIVSAFVVFNRVLAANLSTSYPQIGQVYYYTSWSREYVDQRMPAHTQGKAPCSTVEIHLPSSEACMKISPETWLYFLLFLAISELSIILPVYIVKSLLWGLLNMFGREGLVTLHILKAKYLYHIHSRRVGVPPLPQFSLRGIANSI